ncbi:protein MALE DISCOVERER 2-like isoform X1 [Alnus glutinosa]|uniref:protein MALE DISCOVERER 2-like isoform X1 n=1 Tax=Alnus glutinosa TaxID=3517 RepID=UPI002D79BB38|nr:protein MALE DISCOVERER 2-like isoform X1 [Alnus glutinosa]XP_062162450.1 protein MALE DISCOVERER 2-like isoform X1 [Alnus glutinosa]
MGGRWDPYGFGVSCFLALILVSGIPGCWSLNGEGLALLEFQARIDWDPYRALENWSPNDADPCMWSGVSCVDGEVQMLDLSGLSLVGTLAPELGKLCNLRSLVLFKNHFSGAIPKEIGELTKLEWLDLRDNNLSGAIPAELGRMLSLKRLLLCDNEFEGSIPLEISLDLLTELEFDDNLTAAVATGISCVNRKFGHCIGQSNSRQFNKADSFIIPIKGALTRFLRIPPLSLFKFGKDTLYGNGDSCCNNRHAGASEPQKVHIAQKLVKFARRKLLEHSSNLAAAPAGDGSSSGQIIDLPTTRSSGAFPAVPNKKRKEPPPSAPLPSPADSNGSKPDELSIQSPGSFSATPTNQQHSSGGTSGNTWKYFIVIAGVAVLLIVSAAVFCMFRSQAVTSIGPWKTGLSGQLQKAFITGVPKLNRSELETACEDFSNIIDTLDDCTIYKGTLSSGVEIAVASTLIKSSKDWPKNSEMAYRKKIDTLSRVNHKNFVNLIGYCEEDEPPFVRMMVFEYAPNGSLFEHLHVKEVEHLDWNVRMRVIMGTAYCLQYMHHDLNPPIAHSNLNSTAIYLTDDYAAKIAEISFGLHGASKSKTSVEDEKENSELPPLSDPETNVYSFGILLLEIISGKLPYSEEQGHLVSWAAEYINDKRSISYMIDPTLKSFKNDELDVICEVIQECIQLDPMQRPTMKSIIAKLREVISITPDQATPRLSPLWWAELEILSVEAT